MDVKQTICQNCNYTYTGNYCGNCGEKKFNQNERKVSFLVSQFLSELTSADNRFLKTLVRLFTKPGELTKAYVQGIRKLYTKPISLFFIVNLLYFLFQPVDSFNSNYYSQIKGQSYSKYAQKLLDNKREQKGLSVAEYSKIYNQKSTTASKSLLILVVILFSIPLSLVYYSRKQYYFNHIIFSLHYMSFLILGVFLIIPSLVVLSVKALMSMNIPIGAFNINSPYLSVSMLLIVFAYLAFSLFRFYQQKIWITVLKATILTICTFWVMIGYRFILLIITANLV